MIVGVPRETFPGERRVALVPSVIPNLAKVGLEVVIEAGAGAEAGYPDAEYVAKGGKVLRDRAEVFRTADIITQVLCYGSNDRTGKDDLPSFIAIKCSSVFCVPSAPSRPLPISPPKASPLSPSN